MAKPNSINESLIRLQESNSNAGGLASAKKSEVCVFYTGPYLKCGQIDTFDVSINNLINVKKHAILDKSDNARPYVDYWFLVPRKVMDKYNSAMGNFYTNAAAGPTRNDEGVISASNVNEKEQEVLKAQILYLQGQVNNSTSEIIKAYEANARTIFDKTASKKIAKEFGGSESFLSGRRGYLKIQLLLLRGAWAYQNCILVLKESVGDSMINYSADELSNVHAVVEKNAIKSSAGKRKYDHIHQIVTLKKINPNPSDHQPGGESVAIHRAKVSGSKIAMFNALNDSSLQRHSTVKFQRGTGGISSA